MTLPPGEYTPEQVSEGQFATGGVIGPSRADGGDSVPAILSPDCHYFPPSRAVQPEPPATGHDWVPSDPPPPGVKVEKWSWALITTAHESAVELWRDDDLRVTIPLTADQTELLLGHPHTLASALEGFPGIAKDGE